MAVEFSEYEAMDNSTRFVLEVPLGASSARVMMRRKDAEELLFQMAFVLGYKIDLTS